MNTKTIGVPVQLLLTVTYVAMIAVNALANILPINGRTTGGVSDAYRNLFTPAPITFSIWGVIYLLLGLHVLYQWGLFQQGDRSRRDILRRIGLLFAGSSLANTGWIFAWHYDFIGLSTVLMLVILVCLILINQSLRDMPLSKREAVFVRLPFSVYLGWITVATVANITVLLSSLGWDGFGLSEATWAVLIIGVAVLIGAVTILRNRDVAYGLVLVWAFVGILIKHTSESGFNADYPIVIATVVAGLVIFLGTGVSAIVRRAKATTDSHLGSASSTSNHVL